MSDNEFLITTRRRRANAGSRLKQLIDLEGQAEETQQSISRLYSEEDENVNLLFQEDENDVEFMEEESEENEDNDSNESNDEENVAIGTKRTADELDEEEATVNSDEQLSDSDISGSDTDTSEGENELQKEEKSRKRRLQKKQKLIPIIKKVGPKEPVKKKPKFKASDALLVESRRSSSRSSVLENKQALVEKLKESERRRAQSTPVVRIQHKDLTQEEKLAEAVETEKANVLSLNQFMEQEIEKKERQRQMLWLKKVKLRNVIRTVTKETFISPLDEVLESRYLQQLLKKAKKRPGRKKKVADKAEFYKLPGELDMELPLVKEEMARKQEEMNRKQEEIDIKQEEMNSKQEENSQADQMKEETSTNNENETNPTITDENENKSEDSSETKENVPENELRDDSLTKKEENSQTQVEEIELDPQIINGTSETSESDAQKPNVITNEDEENSVSMQEKTEGSSEDTNSNSQNIGNEKDADSIDSIPCKVENDVTISEEKLSEEPTNNIQVNENHVDTKTSTDQTEGEKLEITNNNDITNNEDKPIEIKDEEKRVKFADDVNNGDIINETEEPEDPEDPESNMSTPAPEDQQEEVFEGPSQKVARNNVFLIDFGDDTELNEQNIKKILFGEQALLPASRRFKDLTTEVRIRKVENPYAVVKYETDSFFSSAIELTEESSIFDELRRLPKFGELEADVEEVEDKSTEETTAIVIKTEAPTGLYLPNGNKKNCLISGTEVKYFDPNNGIPYSSVETYRFLKSIEQGNVPWYSLSQSMNDSGAAEFYLGSRDGSVRHAKGVPDDFDI